MMFKDPNLKKNILFGLLGAILYSITAFIFIQRAVYTDTWILYVGNFVFMLLAGYSLFYISHLKDNNMKVLPLMACGERTVIIGVIASVILSIILLLIMVPGLWSTGHPVKELAGTPSNSVTDRTHGLDFTIIINAVIGNFVTGSFVSCILPASLKKDQTTGKGASA